MPAERFTLRSAAYLILQKDDNVLLLRRANTGWMDGKWDTPAGHLDGNEPVSQAMIREAGEEVGIILTKDDLTPATVMHRRSNFEYIDFYFTASHWEGEPRIVESDKCDEIKWFPINNLPEDLVPYTKQAIKNYQSHIPFAEYNWE